MFLGFSILQLLEYGVVAIITPINKFHDHLRSRISGLEPTRQFEQQDDNESQHEVVNGADDNRGIKLDEKRTWKNCTDCTEETKVNTQEITEIKHRMDKLFKMVENNTNNEEKIRQRSNKIFKK